VQFFDLLSINYKKLHKKITKTIKNQQMKTTAFTDIHIALGAKMHEFAGYNMPIEYSRIWRC
jgi:hypothetical protein